MPEGGADLHQPAKGVAGRHRAQGGAVHRVSYRSTGSGGAFDISGIVMRYDDQTVTFTPVLLYGQGVTGCLKAIVTGEGHRSFKGHLFMRSGTVNDWTFTPFGDLSRFGQGFDESTFLA